MMDSNSSASSSCGKGPDCLVVRAAEVSSFVLSWLMARWYLERVVIPVAVSVWARILACCRDSRSLGFKRAARAAASRPWSNSGLGLRARRGFGRCWVGVERPLSGSDCQPDSSSEVSAFVVDIEIRLVVSSSSSWVDAVYVPLLSSSPHQPLRRHQSYRCLLICSSDGGLG